MEGWPSDYWLSYTHPTRQGQLGVAIQKPLAVLNEFITGKERNLPGFIFYGPPGYGKTATALMLLVHLARRGYTCRFLTAEKLAARRESTAWNNREGQTSLSLMEELLAPDALLLDDVGTRDYDPRTRALLLELVRDRKSAGKLTFFTTNLALKTQSGQDAFERSIDGRVLSTYTGRAFNAENWSWDGRQPESLRKTA